MSEIREITILSGKGGTGKTSVAAALASVANRPVLCDNDVDASNLFLLMQPKIREEHTFTSGYMLSIDPQKCIPCEICTDHCRFGAIQQIQGKLEINPYQCEGCRLCEKICPLEAISSVQKENNFWHLASTRFGPILYASMGPGEENSGKLVTQLRQKAMEIARKAERPYIISDGPPGIGCPVIASLNGTGKVLLVLEPSRTALLDAARLVELVRHFNIELYAVINKYDLNTELCKQVEMYLNRNAIPVIEKLPFDPAMVEAMIREMTITEYKPGSTISKKIARLWKTISLMN